MKEAYKMKFDYVFKKSYNILQPKRVSFEEVDNDYYVSPRKLIRYMECEGFGFIFCDYFTMQTIIIATQEDSSPDEEGYDPEHPYKLNIDMKARCKLKKNFVFDVILLAKYESDSKSGCQNFFEPFFEDKLRETLEEFKKKHTITNK